MKKRLFFLLSVSVFLFVCILPFFTEKARAQQDQIAIPSITPFWIKRRAYDTSTSLVLSKGGKGQTTQTTGGSSINLATAIPSAAGALSVIGGSLFTWVKVKQKNKMYRSFMREVSAAEKQYNIDKQKSEKKAIKTLEDTLAKIQEAADLAAADKNIEDEQRNTITNTIERKLSEIKPSRTTDT